MARRAVACPACGTPVPRGRSSCPACGRALGEDNLCPHCNAAAPVRPARGGYVCAACGQPRARLPGTLVSAGTWSFASRGGGRGAGGGEPDLEAWRATARRGLRRGRIAGRRLWGGLLTLTGILLLLAALPTAALAVVASGGWTALFGGTALALAASGGLALVGASRARRKATEEEKASVELEILALAERSGGVLSATDVARALSIPVQAADRMLSAMADGVRVVVELDRDGLVHYEFRELRRSLRPSTGVRVATHDEPGSVPAHADEVGSTFQAERAAPPSRTES
ncbi:MAG: hypothetical protein NZ898_05980 [Myxococcota bacterium]|nr:hypothetical protein [Myxococcota bacterium]MDW8361437.1 hypothetical protein [Myxococcales bacterium]